ncbi:unnamed protein product [Pleuronectes platessa]|uniref:Uncharacterized protein n=1 Tax=Pleuronectes platessa TaxID=8262 RepID=A0A9N7V8F9_PLEPL|nr:unnamed protein product [Pleuronectes platessa]
MRKEDKNNSSVAAGSPEQNMSLQLKRSVALKSYKQDGASFRLIGRIEKGLWIVVGWNRPIAKRSGGTALKPTPEASCLPPAFTVEAANPILPNGAASDLLHTTSSSPSLHLLLSLTPPPPLPRFHSLSL